MSQEQTNCGNAQGQDPNPTNVLMAILSEYADSMPQSVREACRLYFHTIAVRVINHTRECYERDVNDRHSDEVSELNERIADLQNKLSYFNAVEDHA